ncbi:hypothetical protein DUNSADRAFT_5889 [Dunaliella salina]|uniref:adenylate kinase n=1 Tax=Dunaliella salina TaxID=3046 RepID=A0ABQ7GPH1_DUNSA|nr:hypothetical protein DUNSADRAFT_5889 [Dunaliella salina]|eukprot:KAF5836503.1 hypothetical protein DUNSADRAFT_5889 [Dunaliella salina]
MAQPNTVFIHPVDNYLGKSLGAAFKARGYEVLGAHLGDAPPSYLSGSYKIGSSAEVQTRKQFLALASVVVYELHNYAHAVRDAAVQLTSQPFGGRQQVFIGVTTPLVWAATRPPPPKEDLLEDEDESGSSSDEAASPPPGSDLNSRPASGQPRATPFLLGTSTGLQGTLQQPQPPDAYTIAAALGALTDRDAPRRAPGLTARDTHEVTAWEVTMGPAVVYGPGTNKLPMVHVDDLAAYIAAAASEEARAALPETQQYLLVTDCASPGQPGTIEQKAMVTSIAERLGTGEVKNIPSEELLFSAGGRHAELFTLDAPMATTPLSPAASYTPKYSQGFLANLEEVINQWLTVRNVRPLRILLAGPPMAGKTTAATRLAELYNLKCINAKDLLAAKNRLPPDLLKVFESEMSGKEPRASAATMAALFRELVAPDLLWRNRGFVLDGWPRTANAARCAFMQQAPLDEEDQAELAAEEAAKAGATPAAKPGGKGKAPPPPKKDPKASKAAPAVDGGPSIAPGNKLVPDAALAPTHFIELDADEEVLQKRLQAVEAAEQEALRSSTPAPDKHPAPPRIGRGQDKVPVPQSHNNEKDFARRLEAWNRLKADDQEEMSAKTQAAQQVWEYRRSLAAEAAAAAHAEASTLRAKRKRAKAQEAAAARAAADLAAREAVQQAQLEAVAAAAKAKTRGAGKVGLGMAGLTSSVRPPSPSQSLHSTAKGEGSTATMRGPGTHPAGGQVGLPEGRADGPEIKVQPSPAGAVPTSPAAEVGNGAAARERARVHSGDPATNSPSDGSSRTVFGPEWVGSEEDAAAARADAELARIEAAGPKLPRFGGLLVVQQSAQQPKDKNNESVQEDKLDSMADHELEGRKQAAMHEAHRAESLRQSHAGCPLRQQLMRDIIPSVCEALTRIAAERPADPLRLMGEHLIKEAQKLEVLYVDPYSDPKYDIQANKIRAKAERDQARARAAKEKADKELAAKQAAKVAEGQASQAGDRGLGPGQQGGAKQGNEDGML